jgi:hypothetical protein
MSTTQTLVTLASLFGHYFIHPGHGGLVVFNYLEYTIILSSCDVSKILLFTQLLFGSHEICDA